MTNYAWGNGQQEATLLSELLFPGSRKSSSPAGGGLLGAACEGMRHSEWAGGRGDGCGCDSFALPRTLQSLSISFH